MIALTASKLLLEKVLHVIGIRSRMSGKNTAHRRTIFFLNRTLHNKTDTFVVSVIM